MSVLLSAGRVYPFTGPAMFKQSVFSEDATALARASTEEVATNHYALKLANQLNYANKAYDYKSEGAGPRFYGYTGIGYAGTGSNFRAFVNTLIFSRPIYRVSASQPTTRVWRVKLSTETLCTVKEEEEKSMLGSYFEHVPMPLPSEIVAGSPNAHQVFPEGTDKPVGVWRPATDEYWEMYQLSQFAAGEHKGEWKFALGGYMANVSLSNGIMPVGWGSSSSGLAFAGHGISMEDLVRVLRGGKIGHALGLEIPCTKGPNKTAHLEPATSNDSQAITAKIPTFTANLETGKLGQLRSVSSFLYAAVGMTVTGPKLKAGTTITSVSESGKTLGLSSEGEGVNTAGAYELTNPAAGSSGTIDAVPEGAWFAFPASTTAASVGISASSEPIAAAVYEAIRAHGVFVCDSKGGSCALTLDDMRVIGSPFTEAINPVAGYSGYPGAPSPTVSAINEYVNSLVPSGLTDPTLPAITESFEGSKSLMFKMPWQTLEQLKPRSG
jgi:hypothetical protein